MPPKLARMRKSASRRPTGVFCSRVPKICASEYGVRKASPVAVEEGQEKPEGHSHEDVEEKSTCEILEGDEAHTHAKNCRFQGIVQRGVEIAEAVDAELLENAQLQKNICEPAGAGDGVDHPEIQAKD